MSKDGNNLNIRVYIIQNDPQKNESACPDTQPGIPDLNTKKEV